MTTIDFLSKILIDTDKCQNLFRKSDILGKPIVSLSLGYSIQNKLAKKTIKTAEIELNEQLSSYYGRIERSFYMILIERYYI